MMSNLQSNKLSLAAFDNAIRDIKNSLDKPIPCQLIGMAYKCTVCETVYTLDGGVVMIADGKVIALYSTLKDGERIKCQCGNEIFKIVEYPAFQDGSTWSSPDDGLN